MGAPGRCHDAYVYGRSRLCELIESGLLESPAAIIENYSVKPVIICDQAFPLTEYLMKPYLSASPRTTEAVFNCSLLKTKRIVENAFGLVEGTISLHNEADGVQASQR